MAKYECKVCGYIYNEQYAGAPFSETEACPICGVDKKEFVLIDGEEIYPKTDEAETEATSEEVITEAPVEEAAEEIKEETIASAPVVEPLFGIKNEEPEPEKVEEPEPVMDQNRFNGFAIEKRQEFWKVDEKTLEEADKESIETYYGDTEPVGGSKEEEPEENFRPLWRSDEGTGAVQTVITPEEKEPVVEKAVFEEVEPEAPFFEEVKATEDDDLFEFVELPKEDTDGLDSVAFVETLEDSLSMEPADVVSVESMVNETFFDDDEENEEEITSEFVEIMDEIPNEEALVEEETAEAVDAPIEDTIDAPVEEDDIKEEMVESFEIEDEPEEIIEETVEDVVEETEDNVSTEPVEEVKPADGQAMSDEELYAEIFGQPYVAPVSEEVVETNDNNEETVEDIVEEIVENIVEETAEGDSDVEIEFYDADEGVEEIIFEGEENDSSIPVASEDSFEEIDEEVAPAEEIQEEDIETEEITTASEEMVVYSMLKGGMKYSILCDEQAKKVFNNFPVDGDVSNGLENIILLPAQLNPLPLPANAEVDTTTVLGALTSCPVEVLQPFCFSKLFLWGEHIPNNENPEEYNNQAFVLIKGKNGHIPNVSSKAELKEEVEIARERFNGTPVGIDLIAGRVEQDLEACVYANMDFVILNDVSSRILPYAIRKAKNYLNKVNAKIDLLVCVDALKDAQELAKLLALGADFVLVERGFDLEVANKITEDLKEIARSTGHDNVHDINMFDICTVDSDIATYTDIAHI